MSKQEFLIQFLKLVEEAEKILIVSHQSPDDDSIGSTLAIYQILTSKFPNKNYQLLYTTPVNSRYNFLADFDKIQTLTPQQTLSQYDLVIAVDLNRFELFSETPSLIQTIKGRTVCIDHHLTKADKFDLTWIERDSVSCTQVIYQLFFSQNKLPSAQIAKSIFLGIYGDSGSFQFVNPSQFGIFHLTGDLVKAGQINVQDFTDRLSAYPVKTFRIVQEFVKNCRIEKVSGWPDFLISFIGNEFIKNGQFKDSEVSDASHIFSQTYLTAIRETSWGASIHPDFSGNIHISLRSRPGSVNVRNIVEGMGIGGGHDLAAGGLFKTSGKLQPSETINQLKKWLKNNQPG